MVTGPGMASRRDQQAFVQDELYRNHVAMVSQTQLGAVQVMVVLLLMLLFMLHCFFSSLCSSLLVSQIGLWRSVHQQPALIPDACDAAAAWAVLMAQPQQAFFFVIIINFRWNAATAKYDVAHTPWVYTRQPLGPGLAPPRPAQLVLDDARVASAWHDAAIAAQLRQGSDGGPPLPGQHLLADQRPGNCGRPVSMPVVAAPAPVVSGWFAGTVGREFLQTLLGACGRRFPALQLRMLRQPDDAMRLALGPHHALLFPPLFPAAPVTATFSPEPFQINALVAAEAERLADALPAWLGQ